MKQSAKVFVVAISVLFAAGCAYQEVVKVEACVSVAREKKMQVYLFGFVPFGRTTRYVLLDGREMSWWNIEVGYYGLHHCDIKYVPAPKP